MDPTLIMDILARRARRHLGQGLGPDPALDLAAQDILRHCALSLPHAERFCFRAILLGARNRLRLAVSGLARSDELPAAPGSAP